MQFTTAKTTHCNQRGSGTVRHQPFPGGDHPFFHHPGPASDQVCNGRAAAETLRQLTIGSFQSSFQGSKDFPRVSDACFETRQLDQPGQAIRGRKPARTI